MPTYHQRLRSTKCLDLGLFCLVSIVRLDGFAVCGTNRVAFAPSEVTSTATTTRTTRKPIGRRRFHDGFHRDHFLLDQSTPWTEPSMLSRDEQYKQASDVRRRQGHEAAQPLFQSLLRQQMLSTPSLTKSTNNEASEQQQQQQQQQYLDASTAFQLASMSDTFGLENVFSLPRKGWNEKLNLVRQLSDALQSFNYTNSAVQEMFGIQDAQHSQYYASAPVYLKTVPVQTSGKHRPRVQSPVECLTALFLLGWTLPIQQVEKNVGSQCLRLLMSLHLLQQSETNKNLVFAVISLTPLQLPEADKLAPHLREKEKKFRALVLATDWHPSVLGTTSPYSQNTMQSTGIEPVMYIGPDSLALVQNGLPRMIQSCRATTTHGGGDKPPFVHIDVCAGSGIQAIVAMKCRMSACDDDESIQLVVVDVNPRALQCSLWNFCLNGLLNEHSKQNLEIHLVLGDICQRNRACRVMSVSSNGIRQNGQGDWVAYDNFSTFLDSLKDHASKKALKVSTLTANPPFVPAPPTQSTDLEASYGLFSSYKSDVNRHVFVKQDEEGRSQFSTVDLPRGSSSGEEVWRAILENVVQPRLMEGGRVGIVSEFFWSQHPLERFSFQTRIREDQFRLLLLTNQLPLGMATYAQRRTFTGGVQEPQEEEYRLWLQFLRQTLGYRSMSPGLLFLECQRLSDNREKANEESSKVRWMNVPIARSAHGSLWTPSNPDAVDESARLLQEFFDWQ